MKIILPGFFVAALIALLSLAIWKGLRPDLTLINGNASPGADRCYGDESSGVRGWQKCEPYQHLDPEGSDRSVTVPDDYKLLYDATTKEWSACKDGLCLKVAPGIGMTRERVKP